MAVPVRVNEDNYGELQREADETGRSATNMLNRILDTRYGRGTGGNDTQHFAVTPAKTTPLPKIVDTPILGFCKNGHPIPEGRDRCMGKGCKYA